MHHGSCLCGGVRYQVSGDLAPIQVCHCSQCRQAQGAPFATNIPVPEADFQLLQGGELLRAFESSPGKQRVFCSHCGSPLYSRNAKTPGVLRIRAGSLEGELATRPVAHFYVASKANWWTIGDDLPQFPEAYRPKP
ncbi:GFA family protein [Pseudomonas sp. UL073]|uniref:GFA family protein n=1 Tax=Zestomonas insulae TaxID=2809017 RepID=A0ABS2IJM8_9GAMM|nr:GFA family protein [Pseudomonas insulae]MBM7062150.1 GFA family protein [Pseudomonas insulae]